MSATKLWHSQSVEASLKNIEAIIKGLSTSEVQARLSQYGANRLPEVARRSVFVLMARWWLPQNQQKHRRGSLPDFHLLPNG